MWTVRSGLSDGGTMDDEERCSPEPRQPLCEIICSGRIQTFGGPHVLSLLAEVSNRALKAVWFHKWYVHRTLRPEAYGGWFSGR